MSWSYTLLWYTGIFVVSRTVSGYLRSQELYHDLITTTHKFHGLQYGGRTSDQNLQYYDLPEETTTKLYYEFEPVRNHLALQTNAVHTSKIPINVAVPTLQKMYIPNSYSFQIPKQETSEENPSVITSQEVNPSYNKPSLEDWPSPLNPYKKFRYMHEPKNRFERTELNEVQQQHTFEPELKRIFVRPVNKVVHFSVKMPSTEPVKVQYSSPVEVDSFNDDINDSSSVADDDEIVQYGTAETPLIVHNDNNNYFTAYKLASALSKPALPLQPNENVENSEEFPPYTMPNSLVGANQQKDKVMYVTVRSSLGNSANRIC